MEKEKYLGLEYSKTKKRAEAGAVSPQRFRNPFCSSWRGMNGKTAGRQQRKDGKWKKKKQTTSVLRKRNISSKYIIFKVEKRN